ncbi:hypothetical protein ABZT45_36775 [Streptomyces sp. NPDC005356]|uniref:hypothetical protein n=1 Tax=Streptomyces sp. NPDC005356 TaxID=3157167 RepID=UPI0033A3794A
MDTMSVNVATVRSATSVAGAARRLPAPWTLCPEWKAWSPQPLTDAYKPSVRGWEKYKVRETSEAMSRSAVSVT